MHRTVRAVRALWALTLVFMWACDGDVAGNNEDAGRQCLDTEVCANGSDDDCNNLVDDGCNPVPDGGGTCTSPDGYSIDTQNDPNHCGTCGNVCPTPLNAAPACVAGVCGRGDCDPAYVDLDGEQTFGCETICACTSQCTPTSIDECCPGTSQDQPCANGGCGMERRTCSLAGRWDPWSTCAECCTGATENQPCQNGGCGRETRTCGLAGTWGAWSTCTACCPNQTDDRPCQSGDAGNEQRTCGDAGTWGPWSNCRVCTAGMTEQRPCSNGGCGMENRTCAASGTWGAWSTCAACCDGATESRLCGDGCGRQTRTCTGGAWPAWSTCVGDPATTGAICRPSTDACDPAEGCDGTNILCPADYKEYTLPGRTGCWKNETKSFHPGQCTAHACYPQHAPSANRRCVELGYKVATTYSSTQVAGDQIWVGYWTGSKWTQTTIGGGRAMTSITCLR